LCFCAPGVAGLSIGKPPTPPKAIQQLIAPQLQTAPQ
jgi:hypothetical protein